MRPFSDILVYLDAHAPERPGLDKAVATARACGARLTLAAAVEPLPGWVRIALPAKAAELVEAARRDTQRRLDRLAAPLGGEYFEVRTATLSGIPFVEVIRAVKTGGHDLVVKTAHGEAKTSPGSFGSTDMHLLRKCPCPVWLAQPRDLQREGKQRRLLAAVNPLPDPDDPANALNLRILELATWLAGEERAKLFVVRAHESIGEAFLADSLGPDEYAGYLEHIQVVRLKSDQEIIGRFENRAEQMEVRYVMGDPGEAIPAVARDEGIDLIIMGTVARTGIPGLLIGRTAENVLQQVSCSVLGLKPEGFVAPF